MFGFIFYLGGCLVLAFMLAGLYVTLKPINNRDDMGAMRLGAMLFLAIAIAPYAYTEILTNLHGPTLDPAIKRAYEESELQGDMQYYKVVAINENKARAIAVGLETEAWGGTDRPIVAIKLEKAGDAWEATSYYVMYSFRLNRENSTFPPYR